MTHCPSCNSPTGPDWKFCRTCGQKLDEASAELEASATAILSAEQVMYRLSDQDISGLFSRSFSVEEGFGALLFLNGRHDTTLGPGKHSLGNMISSKSRDASVVIYRTSDTSFGMSFTHLMSKDPLPVNLRFGLIVKIETPSLFWSNVAKNAGI